MSDDSLWTPAGRELAERSFDRRIVAAFYDELSPTPLDGWAIREGILPLPSQDEGYAKVQLLGTTGAGKTTLLRQLIGTGRREEKFPSASPSKTTSCDIEIVTTDQPMFEAVVSFLPKDEVRQYIEESVCSAILSIVQKQREEIVQRRFLEHTDQRFRLKFLLGSPANASGDSGEDDLPDDFPVGDQAAEPPGEDAMTASERQSLEIT
ncbi:MAG: hypothetical protein NTV52_00605, partial [Acidobacteria bacterium]|nr:hypothetical protein [Acidobacteriota bacterium]